MSKLKNLNSKNPITRCCAVVVQSVYNQHWARKIQIWPICFWENAFLFYPSEIQSLCLKESTLYVRRTCNNPCVFHGGPAFISLLDNYVSATGEPEIVTPEEEAENHKFLDSLVQTSTMKVPATERPQHTSAHIFWEHLEKWHWNMFFFSSVCQQIAHKYLVEKKLSPENEKDFKKQLYMIWFELYARKGSSR